MIRCCEVDIAPHAIMTNIYLATFSSSKVKNSVSSEKQFSIGKSAILWVNSWHRAAWAPTRGQTEWPRRKICTIRLEGSAKQEETWVRSCLRGFPARHTLNLAVPCYLTKAGGLARFPQPHKGIPHMTEEEPVYGSMRSGRSKHWIVENLSF